MEENTAPAAPSAAPAPEPVSAPAPASPEPSRSTEASAPEPKTSKKFEASPKDALDRAFDAVFEDDDVKPQSSQQRDKMGRFRPNEASAELPAEKAAEAQAAPSKFAPPDRFSADAKVAWEQAPEPVKAEVNRAITELTNGIEKYKQDFEPYRAFDQRLKAEGQTFEQVLGHYTGMEQLLAQDPVRGLDQICRNLGTSLEDVARHVLGQPQDERSTQSNNIIAGLQHELQQVKAQLTQFSRTAEEQAVAASMREVSEFAKANPRVDELAEDIKFFLEAGRAKTLADAYQMADRLNPAPSAPAPVQPAPAAQTRPVRTSISGAPASGSTPGARTKSASIDDALNRAMDTAGY